jgi:dCTP deaminase
MAVLSKREINERRKLRVSNQASLVITPMLQEDEAFDEDSVDLRLGTYFLMPQVPPQPFVDPNSSKTSGQSYLRLHLPLGAYFVLPAHQTVLGVTLEYIKMPFNVSGQILTKSSIARMFMVIETAPWIHPLYRGCLTLEIANVSNSAIVLYPGMPIGQLILLHTAASEPAEKLSGTYVGPVYPEAPVLRQPQHVLGGLGLEKYRHPFYGWIAEKKLADQIGETLGKLSPEERASVNTVIQILRDNGVLTADNPATKLFEPRKA